MQYTRGSQPGSDAAFLTSIYPKKHPKTNSNPSSVHIPQAIFYTRTSPYSLPMKNQQISVQNDQRFHTILVPLPQRIHSRPNGIHYPPPHPKPSPVLLILCPPETIGDSHDICDIVRNAVEAENQIRSIFLLSILLLMVILAILARVCREL